MDHGTATPSSNSSFRRNEDIALDLMKFIASTVQIGRTGAGTKGFVAPSVAKTEDQVSQLLELYAKCVRAVQGK